MENYTKEQLQQMTVEELCELVNQQKISWSEWIDAQPDTYDGYQEWLEENNLKCNEENAVKFIKEIDEEAMNGEHSEMVNECMQLVEDYKKKL